MTKTKVKLFIVIISLAIIITTFLIIKNSIKSDSSKTKTRSVFIVKEEIVENIIEISGNIQAAKSQSLQAAGNGSVVAVYGKTGDFVKKGQVLVELDTSEQEYELAKLQYEIAQVKINGSPKELELKRLQLKSLQNKLEDRKIIASFSGLLADFDVAVEDYLEAKDIVGTLIERSYLKASVEVVETDAPKLAAGQKVLCTFPAYPDKVIEGYVVSYPSVGTLTSRGAAIVEVEIRIDNPPEAILPNYSFTGEIEISPKETLLLVEKQAIGFEEGKTFVEKKLSNGNTLREIVKIEPYGNFHVKIIEGNVNKGDELIALVADKISGSKSGQKKRGSQEKSAETGIRPNMPSFGGRPPQR